MDTSEQRQLCARCEGNGVIPIRHGTSVCPVCKGDCWEPLDIPGMNPIVRQKANESVMFTCSTYQPSRHGNAYERKNGEDAICANCNQSQWRHWLKQLLNQGSR